MKKNFKLTFGIIGVAVTLAPVSVLAGKENRIGATKGVFSRAGTKVANPVKKMNDGYDKWIHNKNVVVLASSELAEGLTQGQSVDSQLYRKLDSECWAANYTSVISSS